MSKLNDTAKYHAYDNTICNIFEILRVGLCVTGIFFSEFIYANNPQLLLQNLTPWIVIPVMGLSGIQGMFFGASSARTYERNESFQKQSAANNIALAVTAFLIWLKNWGLYANATILIATLIFLTLSAMLHFYEAVKLNHAFKKHIMRPIFTLTLLAICLPVLFHAL